MLNKLLAQLRWLPLPTQPVRHRHVGGGCSAEIAWSILASTRADGDAKFAAQKEISAAHDAMLGGKMGACAAHLNKAMSAK